MLEQKLEDHKIFAHEDRGLSKASWMKHNEEL